MDAAVPRTLTAARAAKRLEMGSPRAGPLLAASPGPNRIRTPKPSRRVSNWRPRRRGERYAAEADGGPTPPNVLSDARLLGRIKAAAAERSSSSIRASILPCVSSPEPAVPSANSGDNSQLARACGRHRARSPAGELSGSPVTRPESRSRAECFCLVRRRATAGWFLFARGSEYPLAGWGSGGIGLLAALKMRCPQGRRGSSPLSPTTPFLDNILRRPVTLTVAWGCSSVGRAQGWQSWGQGFESPQLHQFSRDFRNTHLGSGSPGCVWVAASYVEPIDRLPVRSRHQMAIDVDGDLDRVMPHLLLHVRGRFTVLK